MIRRVLGLIHRSVSQCTAESLQCQLLKATDILMAASDDNHCGLSFRLVAAPSSEIRLRISSHSSRKSDSSRLRAKSSMDVTWMALRTARWLSRRECYCPMALILLLIALSTVLDRKSSRFDWCVNWAMRVGIFNNGFICSIFWIFFFEIWKETPDPLSVFNVDDADR